jgi:hypothetical protein
MIFLDTESDLGYGDDSSDIVKHRLRLGVARFYRYEDEKLTGRRNFHFKTANEFWQFVRDCSRNRETLWIIAHNILYDFIQVSAQDKFTSGELILDMPFAVRKKRDDDSGDDSYKFLCCLESPPTIIGAMDTVTESRLLFIDTLNYFQESLEECGKEIGVLKGTLPHFTDEDHVWFRYCNRDVDIIEQLFCGLIRFVSGNDLGMFRYTSAAQSMAAFRHKFMIHDIFFHDNIPCKKLERASYFGGRTSCFSFGRVEGSLFLYDCNSLYPSIARLAKFPVKLTDYVVNKEFSLNLPQLDYSQTIAEVFIQTNKSLYPKKHDGKTIYPVGTFHTVLAGPELFDAITTGRVALVRSYATYECEAIFEDFVDYFWKMRNQFKDCGNKLYEKLCKLFLNSLFGKFGQKSQSWVNNDDKLSPMPWTTWREYDSTTGANEHFRSVGWQVQQKFDKEEVENSLPAISSFMTSYGRIRMNKLRAIAGSENVFYQGTDSLLVNEIGKKRLKKHGELSETVLGKLKLKKLVSIADILAKNQYKLDGELVASGLAKGSKQIDDSTFMSRRFTVKEDLFSGIDSSGVREVGQIWKYNSKPTDGTVDENGRVYPIELNENYSDVPF